MRARLLNEACWSRRRYGSAVGYNPFRKQVKRSSDVWFLVSALVVAGLLVVWAVNPF